jgi:ketosteroid isomerase-like protein
MLNLLKTTLFLFAVVWAGHANAAETDVLLGVLKKLDGVICSAPKKIQSFYLPKPVLMVDDHRILLESRIESYQNMIADLHDMKCTANRTVLNGQVGKDLGFLLVDEQISVSSRMSTSDRQHSVCTYIFRKDGGDWKITQEHCSSLPDYNITHGEDALYYYHNPVY